MEVQPGERYCTLHLSLAQNVTSASSKFNEMQESRRSQTSFLDLHGFGRAKAKIIEFVSPHQVWGSFLAAALAFIPLLLPKPLLLCSCKARWS